MQEVSEDSQVVSEPFQQCFGGYGGSYMRYMEFDGFQEVSEDILRISVLFSVRWLRNVSDVTWRRFREFRRLSGHGVRGGFRGYLVAFQKVSENFQRVAEALQGHFRWCRRTSDALHKIRGSFIGFSEAFQEALNYFKGVLEAVQQRFRGVRRVATRKSVYMGSEGVSWSVRWYFRKLQTFFSVFRGVTQVQSVEYESLRCLTCGTREF